MNPIRTSPVIVKRLCSNWCSFFASSQTYMFSGLLVWMNCHIRYFLLFSSQYLVYLSFSNNLSGPAGEDWTALDEYFIKDENNPGTNNSFWMAARNVSTFFLFHLNRTSVCSIWDCKGESLQVHVRMCLKHSTFLGRNFYYWDA